MQNLKRGRNKRIFGFRHSFHLRLRRIMKKYGSAHEMNLTRRIICVFLIFEDHLLKRCLKFLLLERNIFMIISLSPSPLLGVPQEGNHDERGVNTHTLNVIWPRFKAAEMHTFDTHLIHLCKRWMEYFRKSVSIIYTLIFYNLYLH